MEIFILDFFVDENRREKEVEASNRDLELEAEFGCSGGLKSIRES